MKLNKTVSALLLLVLISFNIMISNCEQIKKTKNRISRFSNKRSKINRSHSISETKNYVLDTIKEVLTDPINILYFVLGITAEFTSSAENLYRRIIPIVDAFQPCFEAIKSAYEKISQKNKNDELGELRKSESIQMLEKLLAKKENQKEYCEKTKEEISDYFLKGTFESEPNRGRFHSALADITPDVILGFSYKLAKHLVNKFEYCYRPTDTKLAPKTSAELIKKFGSSSEYITQCLYFNNLDCDIFSPETSSVLTFINKANNFFDLVKNTGICISNLFINRPKDPKLEEAKGINDLFKEDGFFYKALATTLGVLANIFTFGVWGGIKGGYYLIQLGIQIKQFYDNKTQDLPFRLGKMVGKGIAVAKSLLFGRKRFVKKMK